MRRMTATALVWLKRDMRLRDHAPLTAAAGFERALAVFIIEPEWLTSPEFDTQHLAFVLDSLAPLRREMAARGLPLLVRTGPAVQVLESLRRRAGITHLLSHEETGPGWSYGRDRAVAAWCRAQGLVWQEWPQNGVVRTLRSRNGWAARWALRMGASELNPASGWAGVAVDRKSVV